MDMQAKVYGRPGERARTAGTLRVLLPVLAATLLLGVVAGLGLALALPKIGGAVFAGLMAVAAGFFLWAAHLCPKRIDAFFKGARGEERTAFVLEGLPEGYNVFHGLSLSRGVASVFKSDLDHVVVGPAGVFLVETKCWDGEVTCEHGRIWIDGQLPQRDPLAQVMNGRMQLESALEAVPETTTRVRAVLCFAGRGFQSQQANLNDVDICHLDGLARLITTEQGASLTQGEIGLVADRLARML